MKAFRWLMTDLELIYGLDYDYRENPDHFLADRLRVICDTCCAEDGAVFSLPDFEARAGSDTTLEPVLEFFDGLRSDEPRYRWDRLVCLHLLTLAFLNVFGYAI